MESSLPWRQRLEDWPDLWRERWGLRANALEDGGMSWIEAERQAWNEVHVQKRQAESSVVAVVARTQTRTQGRFRATG